MRIVLYVSATLTYPAVTAMDAIIVGIQTQDKYLGKKKTWTRKMFLITDGRGPIEVDQWELTARKMSQLNVTLTVMLP